MGWRVFPTEEEGVWKIRESGTCQVADAPGAAGESWKDQTHFGRWSGIMHIGGRAPSQRMFEDSSYFLAFGAYDCSMLRICAEHGSLSFQHNWLIPLPLCAACKFDLIHQFGGMNHMKTVDQHDKFLSNMLALLECNGVLFVNDHTAREVWTVLLRQVLELKRELAQYVENKDGYIENSRNCQFSMQKKYDLMLQLRDAGATWNSQSQREEKVCALAFPINSTIPMEQRKYCAFTDLWHRNERFVFAGCGRDFPTTAAPICWNVPRGVWFPCLSANLCKFILCKKSIRSGIPLAAGKTHSGGAGPS